MHAEAQGLLLPLWSVAPFILMLLSIAVVPLAFGSWWEKNTNKLLLSIALSLPVLPVLLPNRLGLLEESLVDYVSFMVLLTALFVITGGIYIKGEFAGTPLVNTVFLAVGAIAANLIGTTGASMLLIRPFLRANHRRQHRTHLCVFFIFVVSNIGGLLTPLGDPPLFLGFLRGVPFQWTLSLLPIWVTALVSVLVVFNLYDQYVFVREDVETPGALAEDVQPKRRLHIDGGLNFLFLLGVMLAAILSGSLGWPRGVQEALMIAMAVLSWLTTHASVHKANHFHLHPIVEVAAVFLGIFVTMIPALEILTTHATQLGLRFPWQYFWASGLLSSFLDNAPTYLTFTAMASGLIGSGTGNLGGLLQSDIGTALLRAVSVGSVFMGANTYIGNGPNFMVKSIAESNGVKMPSFGGYMIYSLAVLFPVFVLITFVFFRF
jgi:Na+/H+ antiporter NhaD/arsenite permease-like protein